MKNKTSILLSLVGCALCATFTGSTLANHRSGDWALPEIMTAGDFNQDGNLDLAVNLDLTLRGDIAADGKILTDDGGDHFAGAWGRALGRISSRPLRKGRLQIAAQSPA